MKILTNCGLPFNLAHGGWTIQIQQTTAALQKLGVTVEPMRWWDESQTGDVIHYFGRMPSAHVRFAQDKRMKVVMAELLGAPGARSAGQLRIQKLISRVLARIAPKNLTASFNWESYHLADAMVALTPREKYLMEYLFGADPQKTHVVPNGVEEIFFNLPAATRGSWMVCTATLNQCKRVVELAEAAVAAQTPVWVIGRAYGQEDPYPQKFLAIAKANPQWVRYEGPVNDRAELARIYRSARGFVLLSAWESLSLSALEAAACECPLLLSDQPWARSCFTQGVQFCPLSDSVSVTAGSLRRFYDAAPAMQPPLRPATWLEVGRQLAAIYQKIAAN
jgi:glycosyltransferase involved in cell wall biosynthesis